MHSGIYKITCLPTGKFYIGSSKDINNRFRSHKNNLNKSTHRNAHLQASWLKFGNGTFDFAIIEYVEPKLLLEREQWWLDYTKCYDPKVGFNICDVAGGQGVNLAARKRVADNKKMLLEIASSGCVRPTRGNSLMGESLLRYTVEGGINYDFDFHQQLILIRPDWFISPPEHAEQKKQQLLEMATSGEPRPSLRKHPLGSSLSTYTRRAHECYDSYFSEKIKKLRPDWFVINNYSVNNKQKLIEIAKSGSPRPSSKKYKLGEALSRYTRLKADTYDPTFDKQIRELVPHWFKPL